MGRGSASNLPLDGRVGATDRALGERAACGSVRAKISRTARRAESAERARHDEKNWERHNHDRSCVRRGRFGDVVMRDILLI